MKSDELSEDQIKVLRLIQRVPGLSAGSLEWAYLGGEFKGRMPVPTALGVVGPKLFNKAKKAGTRASELVKEKKVEKRTKDGVVGYWPVASGVVRVSVSSDVHLSGGVARSGMDAETLTELSRELDDVL